jgi:hypothetical protein
MQARKPAVSPHLQPQRFPLSFIVDQKEILNSTSDYLKSFNKDIESDIRFSTSITASWVSFFTKFDQNVLKFNKEMKRFQGCLFAPVQTVIFSGQPVQGNTRVELKW